MCSHNLINMHLNVTDNNNTVSRCLQGGVYGHWYPPHTQLSGDMVTKFSISNTELRCIIDF